MNSVVLDHYLQLFDEYQPGTQVLELGATAQTAKAFSKALPVSQYRGLNIRGPKSGDGWEIIEGNANAMPFEDASYDTVLCNAMLEHDQHFWLTLSEVRRVLRPGGLFFVGVPGYLQRAGPLLRLGRRTLGQLRDGSFRWLATHPVAVGMFAARTFPYHSPPDYYRFSPEAMRTVLLQGFDILRLDEVSRPVRLIAVGRRL